jgi:hypothetical protein
VVTDDFGSGRGVLVRMRRCVGGGREKNRHRIFYCCLGVNLTARHSD